MNAVELIRDIWQVHRKLLLLSCVLLACNLLWYLVLQQLLVPRVLEREQLFMNRQVEARQLLRQSGGLAETPEQLFVQAQRDVAEFHQIIPEHRDFTGLIDELLVLAYRADLAIDQIAYKQDMAKNVDLLKYELSFTVQGRYEQLKKFIHSLEQSPRIMAVSQIALSSLDGEGPATVGLRLKLETVFQSDEPARLSINRLQASGGRDS